MGLSSKLTKDGNILQPIHWDKERNDSHDEDQNMNSGL